MKAAAATMVSRRARYEHGKGDGGSCGTIRVGKRGRGRLEWGRVRERIGERWQGRDGGGMAAVPKRGRGVEARITMERTSLVVCSSRASGEQVGGLICWSRPGGGDLCMCAMAAKRPNAI
jgi:hypothetical protein